MLAFIVKRVLTGVVLLCVLAVLSFFLLHLGAADTAQRIAGDAAGPQAVTVVEERYGLDKPVVEQFGMWVGGALSGNLGVSWFTGQPVTETVTSRTMVTVSLSLGSVILTAITGVVLGTLAATRRGGLDRAVQVLAVIGQAIPGLLFALALVLIFAVELNLFPATGYTRPSESLGGWLRSITLPVIALTLGSVGGVAQQVRGSMIDVLRQDHVRTLRSRGLAYNRVVYRYVLRNAAGPALSVLGLQFVIILSAAVVIEQVFSVPGLGPIMMSSTTQGDIPLVMGIVLITGTLVILVNLLVDLAQAFVNPKVRLS